MQIRDVILGCFMVGWIAVTIITAWKTGTVPAELWAVPGVGIGALMALFRSSDGNTDRRGPEVTDRDPQKELP
jgi:hypothetical protein